MISAEPSPRVRDACFAACEQAIELRALLALAGEALPARSRFRPWLERIRYDLLDLVSDLVAPLGPEPRPAATISGVHVAWIAAVREATRELLPPQDAGRIPSVSDAATELLFACGVAREAAGSARRLRRRAPLDPVVVDYLDELAELLLALARAVDLDTADLAQRRVEPAWLARLAGRLRPRDAVPAAT